MESRSAKLESRVDELERLLRDAQARTSALEAESMGRTSQALAMKRMKTQIQQLESENATLHDQEMENGRLSDVCVCVRVCACVCVLTWNRALRLRRTVVCSPVLVSAFWFSQEARRQWAQEKQEMQLMAVQQTSQLQQLSDQCRIAMQRAESAEVP